MMKRHSVFAFFAMTVLGLALLPGSSSGQSIGQPRVITQSTSLNRLLVGTWTLVSCDEILGNAKPRYCINPSGILMFDANGRYAMVIAARGRPSGIRSASAVQAPAETVKAVVQGVLANFGTWSVNEAGETPTIKRHVESGLFPGVEGFDLEASVILDGDEVKFVGQEGTRVFRRAK
jgi:Lipocalin-like domain